jgi:gamma-glutamyltranspeptidase/glutathione hydrolase
MKLDRSRGAVAVAPHRLATDAAVSIMTSGGTAVDGAIAANAVLGVVLPETCGPGGDLFALIHEPGVPEPWCVNSSGRAGSGASAAALRGLGHREIPMRGPWGVTVPGCVDGWIALSERFGTVPLATCLEPAIGLCSGFPASPELAAALERAQEWLTPTESTAELYPNGKAPRPSDTLARPLLGATLEAVAAHGRNGFFNLIGPHLTAATEGMVQAVDYERPQADWVGALGLDVFGKRGWTVPPNSQGYLTMAALGIAERLMLPPDHEDPAYHHGLIEAYRAVSWERNDLVADPERTPGVDLLAPSRLDERAAAISPDTVAQWPDSPFARAGTAYMCTIDEAGMGVSLIQSNYGGFGSGLSAGPTGIFLQNRGAGFNLVAGHRNELMPGNRPLHTLAPTLWTTDGELAMLLGTRGGHLQPQLLIQVAANLMLARLDVGGAIEAPRWALAELAGTPPLAVEPGFPDGMEARGHSVQATSGPMEGWGPVSIIEAGATRTGAADPRVSTAAVSTG